MPAFLFGAPDRRDARPAHAGRPTCQRQTPARQRRRVWHRIWQTRCGKRLETSQIRRETGINKAEGCCEDRVLGLGFKPDKTGVRGDELCGEGSGVCGIEGCNVHQARRRKFDAPAISAAQKRVCGVARMGGCLFKTVQNHRRFENGLTPLGEGRKSIGFGGTDAVAPFRGHLLFDQRNRHTPHMGAKRMRHQGRHHAPRTSNSLSPRIRIETNVRRELAGAGPSLRSPEAMSAAAHRMARFCC